MDDNIDYAFAFLHGLVHPLILLGFAPNKAAMIGVAIGTGCLTCCEFWLCGDVLGWPFTATKFILAISTCLIGFLWLLSNRLAAIPFAVGIGAGIAFFSHWLLGYSRAWGMGLYVLPVLVVGQLAIYFAGFVATRKLLAGSGPDGVPDHDGG